MSGKDALSPLREHPVFQLADQVAEFIGVKRDLVQLVEFLSLAGGKMIRPVNLDILSDNLTVDLHIANRILDLPCGFAKRIDTHREFRALERENFCLQSEDGGSTPLAIVLIRGNHRVLHRDVTEYTARIPGTGGLPSLWRITDINPSLPPIPSTLRIQTKGTVRDLDDFGVAFTFQQEHRAAKALTDLLEMLPRRPRFFECRFRSMYRGKVTPELMLIFERLLGIVAATRAALTGQPDGDVKDISIADYHAVRALLVNLPLMPVDRNVTPKALETAMIILKRLEDSNEGQSLPDLSDHGDKWFTRMDAMRWTSLAYNTVKKHLRELEGEGLVRTTETEDNRERGRQIHYRFTQNWKPPFWNNPFYNLPELKGPLSEI